jgi:hypothetical protein
MPRINSKPNLAETTNINSPESYGCDDVTIEYLNPSDRDNGIYAGQDLCLKAVLAREKQEDYIYTWSIDSGEFKEPAPVFNPLSNSLEAVGQTVCIKTNAVKINSGSDERSIEVTVTAKPKNGKSESFPCMKTYFVREPTYSDLKGNFDSKVDSLREGIDDLRDGIKGGVPVSLQRTSVTPTEDIALWVVIRRSTEQISFRNYTNFIDAVLCGFNSAGNPAAVSPGQNLYASLRERRFLPFNDTDAYRLLKVATEAFLLVNSGVPLSTLVFTNSDITNLNNRLGGTALTAGSIQNFWNGYLGITTGAVNQMLPYLAIINDKLGSGPLKNQIFLNEDPLSVQVAESCIGTLRRKLTSPFLFELIWSYWQEEGMLVQTMNAIARRFQNMRSPNGARDPLAGLEIDTLRSLSNLLWGYVQDEQHRLNIIRRVYEYDHHYGISLQGKAVPKLHSADSRSKFIEAFHHLLRLCSIYFKQDDDTTVIGDGFPLLNGLKEVHLVLSQGAHNQFGDLPSTARQEMLIQQWILARPEFREFLPTRHAVAYGEPWMDRVEAMKSLQGWTDTSIIHFHNLAVFGEQLLLSIRYGNWSMSNQSAEAANWARYWRGEIQGYIHAYRAVTGVDLSSVSSDKIDSTPPSVHLFNRYMAQARRL